MIQKLLDFLQAHKISSHTIAVAILGFCTLYTTDKQFADWVNGMLAHWPHLIPWIAGFAAICMKYSSSLKRFAQ